MIKFPQVDNYRFRFDFAQENLTQDLMDADYFDSAPLSGSGSIKYWSGSAWISKPLKYWNGVAWASKPLKYWNGVTWVTIGGGGGPTDMFAVTDVFSLTDVFAVG